MIIRRWRAVAGSQAVLQQYADHLERTTFKEMADLPGHLGASHAPDHGPAVVRTILQDDHLTSLCWPAVACGARAAPIRTPARRRPARRADACLVVAFTERDGRADRGKG